MLYKKFRPVAKFIFEGDQLKDYSLEAVKKFWEVLSKECKEDFEEVLITGQLYDFIGQPKIIFLVDKSIEEEFEIKVRKICQELSTELRLDESIHDLSEMD